VLPLNKFTYPEPGSQGTFGAIRKYDIHTGLDLYCNEGEEVFTIESGEVINVVNFTGSKANSPWWNDTQAILIKGDSGVILYGELESKISIGDHVDSGQLIGTIKTVLKKDKGLPMTMLHLELYEHDYNGEGEWWKHEENKPDKLLNSELLFEKWI
jgi:murein DD-endopeptidase MepM/ murein hydrolase activator NlpD